MEQSGRGDRGRERASSRVDDGMFYRPWYILGNSFFRLCAFKCSRKPVEGMGVGYQNMLPPYLCFF